MKVAEITCSCVSLQIPELSLNMVRDEVAHVPWDKAKLSKELEKYARMGGVRVRVLERARETRPPARQRKAPLPPPPQPLAPPKAEELVSESRVRTIVQEELAHFKGQVLRDLRQMIEEFRQQDESRGRKKR